MRMHHFRAVQPGPLDYLVGDVNELVFEWYVIGTGLLNYVRVGISAKKCVALI